MRRRGGFDSRSRQSRRRAEPDGHTAPTDGAWSWVTGTEVHFRPSDYWPENIEVTLGADLYGVELADAIWGEKDRSISFSVGQRHVSVATPPRTA